MRSTEVVLGLGLPQERRLLAAWRGDPTLSLVRCRSAVDLLEHVRRGAGGVALVDDDLHLLDAAVVAQLGQARWSLVALARDPAGRLWRESGAIVLPADAEPAEISATLMSAATGKRHSTRPPAAGAEAASAV
jgi:hypothetical protein